MVDSCGKWNASNPEWKIPRGCTRSISTTFSRNKRPGAIDAKRPEISKNPSKWNAHFPFRNSGRDPFNQNFPIFQSKPEGAFYYAKPTGQGSVEIPWEMQRHFTIKAGVNMKKRIVRIKMGWELYQTVDFTKGEPRAGRGLFGVHLLILHFKFQFFKSIKSSTILIFLNLTCLFFPKYSQVTQKFTQNC